MDPDSKTYGSTKRTPDRADGRRRPVHSVRESTRRELTAPRGPDLNPHHMLQLIQTRFKHWIEAGLGCAKARVYTSFPELRQPAQLSTSGDRLMTQDPKPATSMRGLI